MLEGQAAWRSWLTVGGMFQGEQSLLQEVTVLPFS
jgi:hypothetical protein